MEKLNDEVIKMRYIILVKKGLANKHESFKNMSKIVKEYENQFIPGTVLLSEKAEYTLRIEYPIE